MWRAEFLTLPVETRENKRAIMPVMKKKILLIVYLIRERKSKRKISIDITFCMNISHVKRTIIVRY